MKLRNVVLNNLGELLFKVVNKNLQVRLDYYFDKKCYKWERVGKSNLILIRNSNKLSGVYDDLLLVFNYGSETLDVYSITTDPSDMYLLNGLSKGTAILKPSQILGMWKLGLHRGKYRALVQAKPCWVIRDFNKDKILDFHIPSFEYREDKNIGSGITRYDYLDEDLKLVYREEYGMFGINLHRSHATILLDRVGMYSAGCIVIQNGNGFKSFMSILEEEYKMYKEDYNMTCIFVGDLNKTM
jgi:hypothetical protein